MRVKKNKGAALVMVMMLTLILSILGTAILGITINEYRMEKAHRDGVTAYYLAEAGMEKVIHDITKINDIETGLSIGDNWVMSVNTQEGGSLLITDSSGNITVSVEEKNSCGSIYHEDNPGIVLLYKYRIKLHAEATVGGMIKKIECELIVGDDNEEVVVDVDNRIKIDKWRQI